MKQGGREGGKEGGRGKGRERTISELIMYNLYDGLQHMW